MTVETRHHKSSVHAGTVVCKEPLHSNTKSRGETHLASVHTGYDEDAPPLSTEEMAELFRIAKAHDEAQSGMHHVIVHLWGQG